jgi:hypothetical protein
MMLPTRNNNYKQKNPFQCPCSGYLKKDFRQCMIIFLPNYYHYNAHSNIFCSTILSILCGMKKILVHTNKSLG